MAEIKSNSQTKILSWFTELSSNTNFTDVKVIHDPTLVKPVSGREYNDGGFRKPNSTIDTTQVHGVIVPIIDINGRSIDIRELSYMSLSFNHFIPKLTIRIIDIDKKFSFVGGMGLNNRISVILTPSSNGVYRKMSVPFYIINQTNLPDNEIEFECEYMHMGLWKNACEQIGDKQLTTYEFCKQISLQLQLGFAATDKCEEINDVRWRQIYSQRLSDFIEEQISIGGIDENSIFEAWIDPYGYLNLVNLSWLFSEKVAPEDLEMKLQSKIITPIEVKKPESKQITGKRFITNYTDVPMIENKITNQYNNLSTVNTKNTGTLRNCWILKDAGGTNILELQNIQMIEDSIEGIAAPNFYESYTTEFIGVEMSEDTPYLYQKEIRKSFLNKYRSKQITIELASPNYGFQRGMLINVLYVEYDSHKIKKIVANQNNLNSIKVEKDSKPEINSDTVREDINKLSDTPIGDAISTADKSMVLNPAISGIYYIDGIDYIYDKNMEQIVQYMYLIKKGNQSNLQNPFNPSAL
jgi:hypothetical protein